MPYANEEKRKTWAREHWRANYGSYGSRMEYLKNITKPLKEWSCGCKDKKKRARILLQRAVRKNKITKPGRCSMCKKDTSCINLHGHHENYDNWWEVKWLCHQCHVHNHPEWGIQRQLSRHQRKGWK